jgi:hypothetical protein
MTARRSKSTWVRPRFAVGTRFEIERTRGSGSLGASGYEGA